MPEKPEIMKHFRYDHLPEHLQQVSQPFCALATEMADLFQGRPEVEPCLRKLLEAKDCAVRAALED